MKRKFYQIFTASTLKIIAMILMVVDHFAVMFRYYVPMNFKLLHIISRPSFPIFAYLIIDGIIYSKNKYLYALRMIVLGIGISATEILVVKTYSGNVMSTLGFITLGLCLLENKKWYIKILSIFPLALTFFSEPVYNILPFKCQYSSYAVICILGFYLCYKLTDLIYVNRHPQIVDNVARHESLDDFVNLRNILSSIFFVLFNIVWYFISIETNFWSEEISNLQLFAIATVIFFLMYSGKRGYNKTWFKWFCYIFYPLQFVLVYVCFLIYVNYLR